VDYVILHELCHVIYPYHDRRFYHLLESVIPDWRERRDALKL
jgi:predicted metal-dependent hydrolase